MLSEAKHLWSFRGATRPEEDQRFFFRDLAIRMTAVQIQKMLLLIDNYDSFTYNLAQYFGELGCELVVRRNDTISLNEIEALAPERICISPGPCTPREAGISKDVILAFGARTPILGVCLGHQCIAEAYGGEIVRASRLMHGKASTITHNGNSLFSDLATSFEAGRYHSLVVKRTSLPALPRDHCRKRRRRNHGALPSRIPRVWSAVPPRVRSHP